MDYLKHIDWKKIVWWSHQDLCRLGIDTINLICAMGLPGSEAIDIPYCLAKIDEWAKKVETFTAQMKYLYERDPESYGYSLGYFKALCLSRFCSVIAGSATLPRPAMKVCL